MHSSFYQVDYHVHATVIQVDEEALLLSYLCPLCLETDGELYITCMAFSVSFYKMLQACTLYGKYRLVI